MIRDLPKNELIWAFKLAGYERPVGHMLDRIVENISFCAPDWHVDCNTRMITLAGQSREERDASMHHLLLRLRRRNAFQVLEQWTEEQVAVYGPDGVILLSIERAAAPLFGIVTYGAQLIAYVNCEDGIRVWVQRRAKHKRTFPGLLDSTVGGCIRTGELPFECLVREADEEASIPPNITRNDAVAIGTISYLDITDERSQGERGLLCPDTRIMYELELPDGLVPTPKDGEVEEFLLLSIDELKDAMSTNECTNSLIFIHFFIKRGIMTYENEPHFPEIISRLHRDHAGYRPTL